MKIDITKSIEEIENDIWPDLEQYETGLIEKCYLLRKIPLEKLTKESIRMLLGQNIGNEILIPLALDLLEKNIFIECDFYEGDLLFCVLNSEKKYWLKHNVEYQKMINILDKNHEKIINHETTKEIYDNIISSIKNIRNL